MNNRTYPLGVWEMYDKVKDLETIEIINECFKEWWKYKEIERLNNIIKRMEEDLREMYITFGEFNEEYTEKKIKELKEGK